MSEGGPRKIRDKSLIFSKKTNKTPSILEKRPTGVKAGERAWKEDEKKPR